MTIPWYAIYVIQKNLWSSVIKASKLLSNYINIKPNLITKRYKFKERKQAVEESIMHFITSLKKMLEFL